MPLAPEPLKLRAHHLAHSPPTFAHCTQCAQFHAFSRLHTFSHQADTCMKQGWWVTLCLQNEWNKEGSWVAHKLEAWIAGWDAFQPHVLYTGADDAVLKVPCLCARCARVRICRLQGPSVLKTATCYAFLKKELMRCCSGFVLLMRWLGVGRDGIRASAV